ncbi:MAG: U32 family peptidase [Clostridiales bacterium]|nr:U32 family peptidase [Clostridiales bacterium]
MKHELLAPAGSPEICRAVLAAGADAVYLGGEKYGARAFAQNFSEEEILEVLDLAHLHGKKIFLTVNTLLKNLETGEALYRYLKPYYEHGLDAIIVQDFGVFQFVRKYFPELPVHASTQMSVANADGARFLIDQGAGRIVTARELSLPEIRRIYDETGAEIESFVHGALCYCYSGQCLMSSLIGGRSGNRGRCAQPCRLPYRVVDADGAAIRKKEKYPLSPKDLCALELIPQLCEAGIYSFKIEGRMKSLEYAAGVTQIYRKYLDLYETAPKHFSVEEKDKEDLLALGNRNGFTRGYYEMRNGREMMTLHDSSHSSENAARVYRQMELQKIPVEGKAVLRVGEPVDLTLQVCSDSKRMMKKSDAGYGAISVTVAGEPAAAAEKRPLSEADVRERLSKTGDTPFELSSLEVEIDSDCFVPVRQLNELRRAAFCRLKEDLLSSAHRRLTGEEINADRRSEAAGNASKTPFLNVQVSTWEQLREALQYPFVDMISLDFSAEEVLSHRNRRKTIVTEARTSLKGTDSDEEYIHLLYEAQQQIHAAGKQAAYCFPYVFRMDTSARYSGKAVQDILRQFDTIRVRSYDSLGFCLNELGLQPGKISLDYNLYIYSEAAYRAFEDFSRKCAAADQRMAADGNTNCSSTYGFHSYTASFELNRKELSHMPNEHAEFCLYGYQPMMISAQCAYKNYLHCMKKEPDGRRLFLVDRQDKKFLINRNCRDCYNVIYNSQPLYLFHQADPVKKIGFGSYRISFVTENTDQVRGILSDYRRSFPAGEQLRAPVSEHGFTTGHFRRGVD